MAKRQLKKHLRKAPTMRDKLSRVPKKRKLSLEERAKSLTGLKSWLVKEINLPLPNNKLGKFLGIRLNFAPSFLSGAWDELRQVAWPTRRETWKLTSAVFLFALFFAGLVTGVDYILDKIFRSILLK